MPNDPEAARRAAIQWLALQLAWERQLAALRKRDDHPHSEPRRAA